MQRAFSLLFKNRSVQVFFLIALYLLAAPSLPTGVHKTFYTISVFIKDLLLWMLPITVGFFIAHAISSFKKQAHLFIISILIFEAFSNAASVWYVFGCGQIAASHLPMIASHPLSDTFDPLWRLPFVKPIWWAADKGTFVGAAFGLLASFKPRPLRRFIRRGKRWAELILTRFFSRLIPLFILGFVARMYKTQILNQMFAHHLDILLWLVVFLSLYIVFLFLLGSGFSFSLSLRDIKNLLPAAGVAFSSGCSISTMPWTIEGASKNLNSPELAKAIIPATTNIQQIGDCIANTFLCFLIFRYFNGYNPDLSIWLPFSAVFVLARFATAAVLGGAIFIMLPIYESYLSFNAEMVAMILAFNVILDPLITCSNVIANGALCRVFEKVWNFVLQRSALVAESE